MAWSGAQYSITASAAKLTTILGLSANTPIKEIVIKNAAGAANTLYVGPSTVTAATSGGTARVELAANQAWSAGPYDQSYPLWTDMIWLIGTSNSANVAYISVVL